MINRGDDANPWSTSCPGQGSRRLQKSESEGAQGNDVIFHFAFLGLTSLNGVRFHRSNQKSWPQIDVSESYICSNSIVK
jgi:hypothetical protein